MGDDLEELSARNEARTMTGTIDIHHRAAVVEQADDATMSKVLL